MSRAEFWLTWLLRLNAGLLCTAALTIALPVDWMASTHRWLGLGQFPEAPITDYMARSLSALYAAHGVLLLFISLRPRRYWPLVPVIAVLHLVLGAVLTVIDLQAPMPWYWTAAEGPSITVYGAVIFWLWFQSNRRAAADAKSSR